ncbi:MAG: hypothetical protein ABIA76_02760 [Candidatus Diapherotrites archaeon]
MFGELFNIFLQRKSMKELVSENTSFGKAISRYLAITILGTIVYFLISLVGGILQAVIYGNLSILLFSFLGMLINAILFPISLIAGFVILYVLGAVVFALARLLGGKGGFIQFMNNLLMIISAAGLVSLALTVVWTVLSVIPYIGFVFGIIGLATSLAIAIYVLYMYIKIVSVYFDISMMKAFIAWFVPLILLLIILAVLFIIYLLVFSLAAVTALLGSFAPMAITGA